MLDGNTSSQRPNLVGGVPIYASNQTMNNWFNAVVLNTGATGTGAPLRRGAS